MFAEDIVICSLNRERKILRGGGMHCKGEKRLAAGDLWME